MTNIKLHPSNDLAIKVLFRDIDPSTGEERPIVTGTANAFLATSSSPTATPIDATVDVAGIHIGDGQWLFIWQGSVLTPTLLETHFDPSPAFVIFVKPNDVRVFLPLDYLPSREGSLIGCN